MTTDGLSPIIEKVMASVRQTPLPEGACDCFGTGTRDLDGVRYKFCHCEAGEAKRLSYGRLCFSQAEIPPLFASVAFEKSEALQAEQVKTWADTYPDGSRRSLYLHSKEYGVGKTALAVCVLRRLMERGYGDGLFVVTADWLQTIKESYDDKSSPVDLREVGLLLLDDIGGETPTPWAAQELYRLINHRHDYCKPTLFTSNFSLKAQEDRIGARTCWRIAEMADVVKVTGENMRARKP